MANGGVVHGSLGARLAVGPAAVSDADGIASVVWALGVTVVGPRQVRATAAVGRTARPPPVLSSRGKHEARGDVLAAGFAHEEGITLAVMRKV
jgi:hypothetical protein